MHVPQQGLGLPGARFRPMGRCSRITSAICSPTRRVGFRAVMGSWKIIATWLPRSPSMVASDARSTSCPSRVTEPPATR